MTQVRRPSCAQLVVKSISPQMRKYKNKSTRININLYDILDLDEEKMTVKVEPE